MSNEDTVNVDGQEYVFDPEEVTKPEKQEDKVIFEGENR